MAMEEGAQSNWKKPRMSGNGSSSGYYKTQLCRRFRQGACALGSECTFAHGVSELRRQTNQIQQPKLCRMFFRHKHCTYGHTCRFLHAQQPHQFNNAPFDNTSHFPHAHAHAHGQPQPGGGKHDGYFSAQCRVTQTSTAATNASTSTVATSSLHKNEQPYRVKCIFKENELQKISRIYADWI